MRRKKHQKHQKKICYTVLISLPTHLRLVLTVVVGTIGMHAVDSAFDRKRKKVEFAAAVISKVYSYLNPNLVFIPPFRNSN